MPSNINASHSDVASVTKGKDAEYSATVSVADSDGFGSTDEHAFTDPVIAEHWRKVYDGAKYESRHRFDPDLQWTAAEEKTLLKKIDWRIMIWAWLMFFSMDLNRKNINRAISDNMLPELKMNTNDFNYGQTIFLAAFLTAELPSGLISKKLGADIWVPSLIVSWSVVSASQAAFHTKTAYYIGRAILGLLMGGFLPDVVLWLTYWYKSNELPKRLAIFWTVLSSANILGSLLAAGILQMRGVNGWSGWRYLFLIEGLLTSVICIFSFGMMAPSATQTRGWLRGKNGWFTDREESIIVNRLLRDDPSKGDMNNREGVGLIGLWKTLGEWELWPLYIVGLINYIAPAPPTTYLSLILRQLGYKVFEANLLAIPSQFLFAVQLLVWTWVSERAKERSLISSLSNIWIVPWLVALITLPVKANPWVRYVLLTGLLSYPYCHAILVGWGQKNSARVRTKAVQTALYNMSVQAGNIIATNIYRDSDKPLNRRGNKILLGISVASIVILWLTKLFYIWRNSLREKKWNALTPEQKHEYILHTKDEGTKRLDFRFAH